MKLAQLSDLSIGSLVRDRVYGGDTLFRLGIIVELGNWQKNSVLVRWIAGEGVEEGNGARLNYYYPDNLEIVCK